MRPRRRFWSLAWGALAAVPACGLLSRDPEPPALAEVWAARAGEAGEWRLLASARAIFQQGGPPAWPELRALAELRPDSLRLRALLQDFELDEAADPAALEALRGRYAALADAEPSAGNAYLAARIAGSEEAWEWVVEALRRQPDLLLAQVLQLGLEANRDEGERLIALLELLEEHPGCAEAWRLLGALGPIQARPDLALAAVLTEPWSPLPGEREAARIVQAERAVAADRPAAALRLLGDESSRPARLIRAVAHAAVGSSGEAEALLRDLVAEDPQDFIAHFDYALLALDYLDRKDIAINHLEIFLELARQSGEVSLLRQTQAELWLERLRAEHQAPAAPAVPEQA